MGPDGHIGYCGDGVVDPGENCDDGNQLDGDGCSSDCIFATKYFAKRTTVAPVIDGHLTEYDGSQAIIITNPERSTVGVYRLVWDDSYLYLAVDTRDTSLDATALTEGETIHKDDGFDLYLDTELDRGTIMNSNDFHIIVNILEAVYSGRAWDSSWNPNILVASRVSGTIGDPQDTDVGYRIELAISWTDMGLGPPDPGDQWGLDISLNDRWDTDRVQLAWWNANGSYNTDPNGWGTLVFLGQ